MFAVVVIAITALNVRTVLSSDRSYDMNTSTIEAISGEDDPIDGGEIGDVEITCSKGGGSGKCYAKRTEVKGNGYCRILDLDYHKVDLSEEGLAAICEALSDMGPS